MNFDVRQRSKIFNNNEIKSLIESFDPTKPKYFCYVISEKGIKMSRIFDVLEYGASHMMMIEKGEKVFVAGEMKILNGELLYNFDSGSIGYFEIVEPFVQSNDIIFDNIKNVSQYMEQIPFFYIYQMLTYKLLSLYLDNLKHIYTNNILLSELKGKKISKETIKSICSNKFDRHSTYMFKHTDQGDDFNRCKKDAISRMNDSNGQAEGKMNYIKLDSDITTMTLFKGNDDDFEKVAREINNNKKIPIYKTSTEPSKPTKEQISSNLYKDHLLCSQVNLDD
jgi:hypothetical protein